MTKKVDRMLDLLVLVGYSVAFPVKLTKRLSGHEQYDRYVMYRAIREGYVLLMRREGKRQVIRSLLLTEKGEDYIAARDIDALVMIYGRMGRAPKVFPSREAKILRLHAIATGLVMARAAGAVIPPLEKPSLLLSSCGCEDPPVDEEKAYYYAPFELQAAFEELDDRVESKTSRLIGVIVRKSRCYCMYYAGNKRIFWQRLSEENHAAGIKVLLQARGFRIDTITQIVIGNRMSVAEKLCRSPRLNGDKYFVVSDFFENCFFVTNDTAGDRLLPRIIRPLSFLDFDRQALASYLPPRTVERICDAEEAHTGRPVLLNHSCDLLLLEWLRQQSYSFQEKPIVLCYDYQKEVMQSVLGDSAEVRATDQTADDKDGSPSS